MRRKDTDYLHAAARTAYMENKLITEDELVKAAGADSAAEAFRLLSGKGIFRGRSIERYEEAFEENLTEAYALIEEMTQELGLTYIFRYPIDGHNMKVMVKGRAAKGDFSELYKSGGTVEAAVMAEELDKGYFSHVPEALGEAGLDAADRLARTRDPQEAAFVIDRAVVRLMSEKAEELACGAVTEYVTVKIDYMNIGAALRLLRMKADAYTAKAAFAQGGSFTVKELERAYTMGYEGVGRLAEGLAGSQGFVKVVDMIRRGGSMGLLRQHEDERIRGLFEKNRTVPFGIEPILTFLYLKEREIRGCRLLLTSKLFGIPTEQILERLRYIYAD